MVRIESLGATAYGGAVTLAEWWDNKRIEEGTLGAKDVLKKASFYTYLGIGGVATLMSAFGWMKQWERWTEPVSHGFLYDLPRFALSLSKALSTSSRTGSTAVQEAQRVLEQHRMAAQRQLAEGTPASRSYQPEFRKAIAF